MRPTRTDPGETAETIAVGMPPNGLSAAVKTMMRKGGVPGVSLAVVSPDRVVLAGGWGLADRSANRSASASTAYLWFSMTKIVTATAALRLADEGRLDLDAPVREYVDYLRAPGNRQPTVRQLLTHTAGLGNPLPIRWAHLAEAKGPEPEALLRRVTGRGRTYRYPVGESARYSNVGYLALGQVITAATRMPFETYVQQSVLRPVGMDHTGFSYSTTADRATGYVKAPRIADPALRRLLPHGVAGNRHGPYLALNPFYVDGPAYGGLVGDVIDAGKFLRMHLCDGEIDGHRVLDPQTARSMRRIDHRGKPFNHGTGWFRRPTKSPERWVEHFGAGAGFWNVMRVYPDRGLGIVIMSNSTTTYDFESVFAHLAGASWS
jgi:CubicO group peptidase (beta-lactamase class C family)